MYPPTPIDPGLPKSTIPISYDAETGGMVDLYVELRMGRPMPRLAIWVPFVNTFSYADTVKIQVSTSAAVRISLFILK